MSHSFEGLAAGGRYSGASLLRSLNPGDTDLATDGRYPGTSLLHSLNPGDTDPKPEAFGTCGLVHCPENLTRRLQPQEI